MIAAWWGGRGLAFDLETTGPEPEEARIVTAHASEVGASGAVVRLELLVNPGIPIPAGATAVHSITDEIAATGFQPLEAVIRIVAGSVSVYRTSGRATLDQLAARGLGTDHGSSEPSKLGEELHRLTVRRSMPADEKAWAKLVPKPKGWVSAE